MGFQLLLALCLISGISAAVHTVSWGFDSSEGSITVEVGDTITWVLNQDSAVHSIASSDIVAVLGSFGESIPANGSYTFVAQLPPGSYVYYCPLHPTTLQATLTVVSPPPAALVALPGTL